jgi:hypothetical protein
MGAGGAAIGGKPEAQLVSRSPNVSNLMVLTMRHKTSQATLLPLLRDADRRWQIQLVLAVLQSGKLLQGFGDRGIREQRLQRGILTG